MKIQETKHTPTPWITETSDNKRTTYIVDSATETYLVATLDGNDPVRGSVTADANALFIVRACNSHDELVAALTRLLDCATAPAYMRLVEALAQLLSELSPPANMRGEHDDAVHAATAALAKAKGGA